MLARISPSLGILGRSALSVLTSVVFALGVAGCGSQRPQDVWFMPGPESASSPTSAQSSGYPFGTSGEGVAGGDTYDSALGDLPEAAYAKQPAGFWRHDEAEARREAKRTGRGLLVSFWADWCDDCAKLHTATLRDPAVRATLFGAFVPLRIDVSEDSQLGRQQLLRYRVDHVPAVLFLDGDGRERLRFEEFVTEETLLDELGALQRGPSPIAKAKP